MKRKHPLNHLFLALACLISSGAAEDAPAPPIPVPPAAVGNSRIQIQGGAGVQVQGGGRVQFQFGNVQVQGAAGVAQANAKPGPNVNPPAILLPGFPTVLLPNPLAKADPRPAYLGVTLDTGAGAAADDAEPMDRKNGGVGVLAVLDESPAAKAGLKEGDQILTFEGKMAKDSTQLRELIRASQPDQNVKLTVRRGGKDMEIKAKLAVAPDAAAAAQLLGAAQFNQQNVREAVPGTVTFRNTVLSNGIVLSGSAIASSTAKTAADDTDTVTLRDGNIFTGKVRGITAEKGLQLQREGLGDLELIEEEITSLAFGNRRIAGASETAKAGTPLPKVVVQMRDGSFFHGEALTMDRGTLLLTLPAAEGAAAGQRIEIPREHVQFATLSDGDAPRIYDGPTGLSGWSSGRYSNGQWEYKDGFLRCVSNGPIGRNLGRMPDPIDMSFEVNYPPQMQHFSFMLFSTDVSQAGVGALNVQFSPQRIFATHFDGQRTNQYNDNPQQDGRVNAAFNAGDKAVSIRYRLLVDRVNGTALIYVNGEKRAEWKLSKVKPEDLGKCGATFSITPYVSMSGTSFQFRRVRVLPWDGKEPAKEAERAEPKADQMLASNGAVTEGTLERITDSEMIFANPASKAKREKTLFVRFAAAAAPKELPPTVAMVQMRGGSEISATKVRGTGDALTVTTRCGPEITVPLGTLRELDYSPRAGQAEVTSRNLDVLTLTDGSQLTGRALLPLAERGLHWKIAASKTPLEFPSAKVAGVLFRSTEGARKTAPLKGDNAMRLANGDWLQGDVVSLDGKRLVMKTDLTPELNVPLSELRAIYLNPNVVTALSDGASGPEMWNDGWVPNGSGSTMILRTSIGAGSARKTGRAWMYHDGSYIPTGVRNSQQTLAKRWPAYEGAAAINFEMISPGRALYFSAQIFNSKEERTFSINANGGRVYVYFNPGVQRQNRVGVRPKQFQIDTKTASTGDRVRVSLVLDRPSKTFRIFIAGKEVGKLVFKEDEAKEALDACGISLSPNSFSTLNGRMQNRVTNMWLAPWNGAPGTLAVAAEKEKAPAPDADPKKDPAAGAETKGAVESAPNIFLANGDEFAGIIEKLTPDLVTVNSDAGPLELPGKRIAWIRFPGEEQAAADHFPRLRFHERGLLSVNDLQIGNDRVTCKTLGGQPLDFPMSVVKEVVWGPLGQK